MSHHNSGRHRSKKHTEPAAIQPPKPSWFRRKAVLGGIGVGVITAATTGWLFYQAHQFDGRLAGNRSATVNIATGTINTNPGNDFGIFEKVSFVHKIRALEDKFEGNLGALAKWLAEPNNQKELGRMWEESKEVKGTISFQNGSFQLEVGGSIHSMETEAVSALESDANFFKMANIRLQTFGTGFAYEIAGSEKVVYGFKISQQDLQEFLAKVNAVGYVASEGQSVLLDIPNVNMGKTGEVIQWMRGQYGIQETPATDANGSYLITVLDKDQTKGILQELVKKLSDESAVWAFDLSGFPQGHFARFHTHNKELGLLPIEEDCERDIKNTRMMGPGVVFRMFPDGMCEAVAMSNGKFSVLGKFKVHEP